MGSLVELVGLVKRGPAEQQQHFVTEEAEGQETLGRARSAVFLDVMEKKVGQEQFPFKLEQTVQFSLVFALSKAAEFAADNLNKRPDKIA